MPDCRILIADDEQLAREAIKLQLKNIADLQVYESADGKLAVEAMLLHRPDIIFLDIQMPLMNGLQVISKLPQDYQPFIIFVTAHDMYALQAFEYDAIDYLLKPFTDKRFAKAFGKAMQMWRSKGNSVNKPPGDFLNQVKEALLHLENASAPTTITVRDGAKIIVLRLDDIMYIEAGGDYLFVFTREKKYLHKETLANMEAILPAARFVRIHKSTIVNCAFIKELHSHFNGDYSVVLHNKQELRLSRNYREKLIGVLG